MLAAACALLASACQPDSSAIDLGTVYDVRLGGDTTAFSKGRNAFELSARNLDNSLRRTFEVGDSFFKPELGCRPRPVPRPGTAWGQP